MKAPSATYRVQLNKDFGFGMLEGILPYLSRLGISHVYASPILQASPGSTHCYDVTDPDRINDELGGPDAFEGLSKAARALGVGWVQDIVPNHMSYSVGNKLISDLLREGKGSDYYGFFDIDWNHPSKRLAGRVLAPFLQESYEESLALGEIKLIHNSGFALWYRAREIPLAQNTYGMICSAEDGVRQALDRYNNDRALLDTLLRSQVYDLEHWRTAFEVINYRRFFDIVGMICLLAQREAVFERSHRLCFKLARDGMISGLRVDHIDGLYDPEEYLERVRARLPEAYVVVEKIITGREELPATWPVQGTTGYDFIRAVNSLFVDRKAEDAFDKIYKDFTGTCENYADILYNCKKRVILRQFSGEIDNLARMLEEALEEVGNSYHLPSLSAAVVELLSSFQVYRSYVSRRRRGRIHMEPFEAALAEAMERNMDLREELSAIEMLLERSDHSEKALGWIMRVQQYTGVVMAKGFEDTLFYVYNRFISLNEVGSDPCSFGMLEGEFHEFNIARRSKWPLSMSPTATHDTKRGEDVRARLNVLSEIPGEFEAGIKRWGELNREKRDGKAGAPDRNEEYYIYQTLLGAFPFDIRHLGSFADRMKTNVVKALREGKVNSSWLDPNERYEQAASLFVTRILTDDGGSFLDEFLPFQRKVAFHGFLNSLSQTLIKITSPGIPDFYQGNELWDLSLVDPDNRRAVDFAVRERMLNEVQAMKECGALVKSFEDGRVKLYEISRALAARSGRKNLFEAGEYIPLSVAGELRDHVVAFCRRNGKECAVTVVPRFTTGLFAGGDPLADVWKDTRVRLPEGVGEDWTETFCGNSLRLIGEVGIGELLSRFPVALLLSGDQHDT